MNRKKRLLAVLLVLLLVLPAAVPVSAKKVKNSSLTIRTGSSGVLKVRINGKVIRKVKWSSSNKNVVSVVRRTGKIRALKPGKAVITGKYGKKRYRITVTVKKSAAKKKKR